ncbi:branched-chain amino acid ABC transporter permease [Aeromicrobium sp. P5_D10]
MSEILVDATIRGSLLALLAVGLTMVQGTLGFANVAHVEFATIAGYLAVVLTGAGIGLLASSALSVVGVAIIAIVLYRTIFRRLLAVNPIMAMIGSLAVSIIVRALIQFLFESRPRTLPTALERGIDIGGALVTPTQVRVVIIATVLLAGTLALLRWTALGRSIRAVASNPELAEVAGLNRGRVVDAVWVLSGALAAAAGILLGLNSAVSPDLGFNLLLPVFAAAIVGGLGSVKGAIIAAYGLSLIEGIVLRIDFGDLVDGAGYVAVSYRPAIGFVLLILVLALRPQGLMGRKVRRA